MVPSVMPLVLMPLQWSLSFQSPDFLFLLYQGKRCSPCYMVSEESVCREKRGGLQKTSSEAWNHNHCRFLYKATNKNQTSLSSCKHVLSCISILQILYSFVPFMFTRPKSWPHWNQQKCYLWLKWVLASYSVFKGNVSEVSSFYFE